MPKQMNRHYDSRCHRQIFGNKVVIDIAKLKFRMQNVQAYRSIPTLSGVTSKVYAHHLFRPRLV